MQLSGRRVLLGVTGGIAAYKAAEVCRLLVKAGAEVRVVMTRAAMEFVAPMTFAALSRHEVQSELFSQGGEGWASHIALARFAELVVVAPATADFLAKVRHGRADDLLSTIVLATEAPLLLAPAMNPSMLLREVTQENLAALAARPRTELCESPEGPMAEPESGPGRLLDPEEIVRRIARSFGASDLSGRALLVTAGPTREPIDPVRYISNRSSGKMGYALATRGALRGAKVTLVSGPSSLRAPVGVSVARVETTAQMRDAVWEALAAHDALIMAAAPADYRVTKVATAKLKKGAAEQALRLVPTDDILLGVRERRRASQVIVGFAAETERVVEHAQEKVARKGLDFCVANLVGDGLGFDVDTNRVWLCDGAAAESLPELPKAAVADVILDRVVALLARRAGGAT